MSELVRITQHYVKKLFVYLVYSLNNAKNSLNNIIILFNTVI